MKKMVRMVSLLLAILMLSMNVAAASNSDDGIMPLSDSRINKVTTNIIKTASKTIMVEFSIQCFHDMKSLGTSRIRFFKKSSDGDTAVKTFWKQDNPKMYTSNDGFYGSNISYKVSSSGKYYAKVTFYATDSSGTSSLVLDTQTITV